MATPIRPLAVACSLALTLTFTLAAGAVQAQTAKPMPMAMPAGSAASTMMQPMQTMQATMAALPKGGNIDQQFAAMMVPHHQAAIDMAKIELASGHDPQMRRLARSIMAAQRREIAQMNAWMAKHPQ